MWWLYSIVIGLIVVVLNCEQVRYGLLMKERPKQALWHWALIGMSCIQLIYLSISLILNNLFFFLWENTENYWWDENIIAVVLLLFLAQYYNAHFIKPSKSRLDQSFEDTPSRWQLFVEGMRLIANKPMLIVLYFVVHIASEINMGFPIRDHVYYHLLIISCMMLVAYSFLSFYFCELNNIPIKKRIRWYFMCARSILYIEAIGVFCYYLYLYFIA